LVCPWNRFASDAKLADFAIRNNLETPHLLDLFGWTEEQFLKNLEGSPMRRMGFERWQRNIAIALGNAPNSKEITMALTEKVTTASEMVKEHIAWALQRQNSSIQPKAT
jgi:epoxyqueuosine reductase